MYTNSSWDQTPIRADVTSPCAPWVMDHFRTTLFQGFLSCLKCPCSRESWSCGIGPVWICPCFLLIREERAVLFYKHWQSSIQAGQSHCGRAAEEQRCSQGDRRNTLPPNPQLTRTKAFFAFTLQVKEQNTTIRRLRSVPLRSKFKEKGVTAQHHSGICNPCSISKLRERGWRCTKDKFIWKKKATEPGWELLEASLGCFSL